jgi:hypothetical protein
MEVEGRVPILTASCRGRATFKKEKAYCLAESGGVVKWRFEKL